MKWRQRSLILFLAIAAATCAFGARDRYGETVDLFRRAGLDRPYFQEAYGYAVFPTIGKGGFILGGAYGAGRVYRTGDYVGDTQMSQLSLGFQLGGQGYSQTIFFKNQAAFAAFTAGEFAFGANASAVAITAAGLG